MVGILIQPDPGGYTLPVLILITQSPDCSAACVSVCLLIQNLVCLSVNIEFCLSCCLFVCLCVCLSVYSWWTVNEPILRYNTPFKYSSMPHDFLSQKCLHNKKVSAWICRTVCETGNRCGLSRQHRIQRIYRAKQNNIRKKDIKQVNNTIFLTQEHTVYSVSEENIKNLGTTKSYREHTVRKVLADFALCDWRR